MVTDEEELYLTMDAYADHGHDHLGNDRGLEGHPILGCNYRISELNAAVGLAQLRKLDVMLERQRQHKKRLKEALSRCSAIRFRNIPDETGDSATFLSFFLPDEEKTRTVVKGLAEAGVDGVFYWYDNNWHYIRKWEHLKGMRTAATLAAEKLGDLPDYAHLQLPRSDGIMSRTISMLIKLSWTEQELSERITKNERSFKPCDLTRNERENMFRNFRMVSNVVYGRGCFNQLGDILAVNRKTSESFMVFLVDDVFMAAPLKDRVPVEADDLLLWVNVDEEPTTAYVDELTEKVKASSSAIAGRCGRHRWRRHHGSGQGRFPHVDESGIFFGLPGVGPDRESGRLSCGHPNPVRDGG